MSSASHSPPRPAERLLALALRSDAQRESVLGDLHEEYAARAVSSGSRAALWYWLQALSIGLRLCASAALEPPGRSANSASSPPHRGDSLMRTLDVEVRHALRALIKRPALTGILVLTLALGLGANAAIFALIDALVLRPFTMDGVDQIVVLSHTRDNDIDRQETVSPADFLDIRAQTDVVEHLAAAEWWSVNLVGRDEPEAVLGFQVSAGFLPALGVQPARGRNFLPDEETQGRHRRVILGHGLWQRRFAGDPSIVGSAIQINGAPYDVVGIAPEGFDFPWGAQLWAPLSFDAEAAARRRSRYLTLVGRLAPGRTLDDARAQMAVIGARLEEQHPDTNRGYHIRVHTLAQGMLDVGLGPILSLWQASAIFVLLIACANVANLLLARGAERQREMAVRLAIGASRSRVVRELLIESTILALVSVPAALAVAHVSLGVLRGAMPPKLVPFVAGWHSIDVDGRLFLFTASLAVAAALVFGLVPAIQAARPRLAESLKEGGRSATTGASRLRLRRGLVIGEVALALPLLVGCGLSILSVQRFLNGPQGYNVDGLLTMQLVLSEGSYPEEAARRRFAERAVEQLQSIPGALHAAAVNIMPAAGGNSTRTIEIDGRPNPDPANPPAADYRTATPGIFETLGIPILAGRGFTEADREDGQQVAIVSQSFAQRHWPDVDPLGKQVQPGTGPWLTVVGVCGDVIHNWFGRRNYPTVYRPLAQAPPSSMALLIRGAGDPAALAGEARRAIRAVDPAQPLFEVMVMAEVLRERTTGVRYVAAIMTAFGGLALLLAVIGVYGIMTFMVTQRTHEIGVRMALGATRRDVVRLAVGQTSRLTLIGAAIGVVLSVALGRIVEAGLLGIISSDLRVVAVVAGTLVTVALAAGYIPARRAAAIDPVIALRAE